MVLIYTALVIAGFFIGFCTLWFFIRKLKAGADKNLINIINKQKKEINDLEINHSCLERLLDTK